MGKTLYLIFAVAYATALAGCNGGAPQDDVPDADLIGTLWTLVSIEVSGEANVQPDATKTYSIQFFENNRTEGRIDCNSYGGEYTISEGDSMQVNIQFITEVLCRDSDKSIRELLLAEFRAVHSFRIIGNQLKLHFDDSALMFRNVE